MRDNITPSEPLRTAVRALLGFAVALVVVVLFVRGIGTQQVLSGVLRADLGLVVVSAVSAVAGVLCWSESQRRVLVTTIGGRIGGRFWVAYFAGDFTKQVLPFGHVSGPALMAATVSQALDESYERTLAGITVSDLLNLVSSIVLAGVGLVVLLRETGSAELGWFVRVLGVALVGVGVLVVFVLKTPSRLTRSLEWAIRALPRTGGVRATRFGRLLDPDRLRRAVAVYADSLAATTRDRGQLVVAAGFSSLGWLLLAAALAAAGTAVGLRLSAAVVLFLVPVAGFATWLPLPGGVGGVEVVLAAGLVATTGADTGLVAAAVLLYRLCSYWVVVAIDGGATLYFTATE